MGRTTVKGDKEPDVRAAGGVVVRKRDGGGKELAVIHRPKYMDWSLPKGKLEKGEDWIDAALREVEEEIGYRCKAGRELEPVSYKDRKGRRKQVRYWLMKPLEGDFEPHGEVDELRWLSPAEAAELLTYEHDRELVDSALAGRGIVTALRGFSRRPWPGM